MPRRLPSRSSPQTLRALAALAGLAALARLLGPALARSLTRLCRVGLHALGGLDLREQSLGHLLALSLEGLLQPDVRLVDALLPVRGILEVGEGLLPEEQIDVRHRLVIVRPQGDRLLEVLDALV